MPRLALLTGFFVVPLLLLVLGHRWRRQTRMQRSMFWGGMIGHCIAALVTVGSLQYPPVTWDGGFRIVTAFWSMLIGAVVGAAFGALKARRLDQLPR